MSTKEDLAGVVALRPRLHGVPPVSDRTVSRPRVTDDLVERIRRHALVQVVAPAGSGKTTAAAQAMEAVDRAVTWLTLEDWHRSPGRLLHDLVRALELVAPGLSGEVTRARAEDVEAAELAAIAGSFVRRQHALLVVDDCHVVHESEEAVAMLAALARRGAPGLHLLLVGRIPLPLARVGVESHDPDATLGDEVLRADREEAAGILRAYDAVGDVDDAILATGGWIAGLVFESWATRGDGSPSLDPLGEYLGREVRPALTPEAAELLVASSIFDTVDATRAATLGVRNPRMWLASLRQTGIPAVWAPDGSEMTLHPRIRELLRDKLDAGPAERRHSVLRAAAETYEREGDLERALELSLEIGDTEAAQRLLPSVILDVVERQDVALAERYLAAVQLDQEPAKVVLARLVLASIRASITAMLSVLNPVVDSGRLTALINEEPKIGTFASNVLAARSIDEALGVLDVMPPGRAFDVARLMLSIVRDDPDAPIPPFTGDVLDAVLARALYCRGHFQEIRAGHTAWAESTGVLLLSGRGTSATQTSPPRFMRLLTGFNQAVAARDLEQARACAKDLSATGGAFSLLAEAELGVRLERDPARSRDAIERLRQRDLGAIPFYRELTDTWDGAARLLGDDAEGAAEVLRDAVASMRRGDRILALPTALVYLAEAEWRLGNENASDRATDEAYEVARRKGSLRGLLLSLADFPGVLSRRVDAEPGSDSRWHSLGRALTAGSRGGPSVVVAPVAVHLREFGEPALVVNGRDVRPKIRKSLELLSYLLLAPTPQVSREAILTALWNGRDDDSTRAYLRQALRHLRDVLPDGIAVAAVGDALSIEGAVTSESLELEALLAEAARDPGSGHLGYLLDALDLAGRGLFLEGSGDVQWIDDRRVQIESIVSDARLDAAELLLEAERYLRALALVDEALDADPLRERAWRLRMRTLDLLGDKDGVTAAYAGCARALAEIGLEPSAQTSELARALRR